MKESHRSAYIEALESIGEDVDNVAHDGISLSGDTGILGYFTFDRDENGKRVQETDEEGFIVSSRRYQEVNLPKAQAEKLSEALAR